MEELEFENASLFDSKLFSRKAGYMKTTLDLPDDLVREVKLRALDENRRFKDVAAELMRKGLSADHAPHKSAPKTQVRKNRLTGLPLIECRKAATREITPQRAAQILLDQDVSWHEKTAR